MRAWRDWRTAGREVLRLREVMCFARRGMTVETA